MSRTGARDGLNVISDVSAEGELRFLTDGRGGTKAFVESRKRNLKNAERTISLVVDGHPAHTAKPRTGFLKCWSDHPRLFFLPPILSGLESGRAILKRQEEKRSQTTTH